MFKLNKIQMKEFLKVKVNVLFFISLFLLIPTKSEAKLKIPFGSRDVIDVVYTTPKQDSIYKDDDKLDIARYYREFNIAYIFPLYIEEEPQLVFYDAKNQLIYDVNTPEQEQFLNEYLKEKGIDKEEKLSLSWYTRWGAKLLFLLLIGIPIADMFCGKDDEIKEPKKL